MTAAGPRARTPRSGLPAVQGGGERWSRREAWTWGAACLRAAGIDTAAAPLEAEVLLRHAAGVSREELLARPEGALQARAPSAYRRLIARRAGGAPASYLVGHREFLGVDLMVDRHVLIPRPETEHLVEVVVRALRGQPAPIVVDVGTGSGAIAIAAARALPRATVLATDVSGSALRLARRNAVRCGVAHRISWAQGPGLRPLDRLAGHGRVDAVVSNPPYIPTSEIANLPREIREHEPTVALDGGPDGLAVHREIIAGAAFHVVRGGILALEVAGSGNQAAAVAGLIGATGHFGVPRVIRDYAGLERVVVATRGADGHHRH
jgi:release factor glutamine methyltransferase